MKLSKDAALFLRDEQRYLEQFNPRAAENVLRQLRAALRLLTAYPQAGSQDGPLDGRRRFVSGAYVIDYKIDGRWVLVSSIRHGRQLPPDLEKDDDLSGDG